MKRGNMKSTRRTWDYIRKEKILLSPRIFGNKNYRWKQNLNRKYGAQTNQKSIKNSKKHKRQ